jgi:hypothetical protein
MVDEAEADAEADEEGREDDEGDGPSEVWSALMTSAARSACIYLQYSRCLIAVDAIMESSTY